MKLYGLCLVKDEDDIIAQSLTYALNYCGKVIVLDNGSTDETWPIVQRLATQHPRIIALGQTHEQFREGLRSLVYNEFHRELSDEDWWLYLDADEFLAEDPHPILHHATDENADIVRAWQIQFSYTDVDHRAWERTRDDPDTPIFARRRYYRINWREPRLFRNQRAVPWDEHISNVLPNGLTKRSKRLIFNRHYQYRSPEQIQKRIHNRIGHPTLFRHMHQPDWRGYIRAAKDMHYYTDGDRWKLGVTDLWQVYTGKLRGKIRRALVRRFAYAG
jgi:glycosyltransferase involved in cell wall biosynthesis